MEQRHAYGQRAHGLLGWFLFSVSSDNSKQLCLFLAHLVKLLKCLHFFLSFLLFCFGGFVVVKWDNKPNPSPSHQKLLFFSIPLRMPASHSSCSNTQLLLFKYTTPQTTLVNLVVSAHTLSLLLADMPGNHVSLSMPTALDSVHFFQGIYLIQQTVFQMIISLVSLGL